MKLFLELGVKGQGGFKSAMSDMANTTSKSTKKMVASWASVENRMSSVSSSLTKIAALLGGGALLRQAVVDVMNFERGLTEMRLTGELTAKEMDNIRKHIIALSTETLQLPEDQLEAFKDMVAAGIDPSRVLTGLKAIDRTATATFANVGDIGKTTVDLFQKMDIKPEKLERSFNILHKAGKSGRFELKDMARFFPEVLASASQYGVTGERGVAQVAAMLQIARRNRGEPGEAATDMKAFFSHIVSYRKQFKKVGFNVYDFIDLKTGKFKAGKDIDSFFEELMKKSKGGSSAMLKSMGIQDTESTNFMAGLMKDWEDYKKIRDDALGAADQDIIGGDFDKVKQTTWAKAKSLEIERSKAMKSTGSSTFAEKTMEAGNWAIEHPVATGAGAIGAYTGWKLIQRYVGGKFGNMGGGALGGAAAGATSVFVTNWPGSGVTLPGGPTNGTPAGAGKGDKVLSWFRRGIPALAGASAGQLGLALGGGYAIGTGFNYLLNYVTRQVTGGKHDTLGARIYDATHGGGLEGPRNYSGPSSRNEIKIDLHIDGQGRAFSSSNSLGTSATVGGRRGSFFNALMTTEAM